MAGAPTVQVLAPGDVAVAPCARLYVREAVLHFDIPPGGKGAP